MPFFLQLVVDRVLVGRYTDFLAVLGIAFAALVLIQVAVSAVRAMVGVYPSTHFQFAPADNLVPALCCGCHWGGLRSATSATSSQIQERRCHPENVDYQLRRNLHRRHCWSSRRWV